MGATTSSNVRKIIWCDIEGGVRGVPVWDCSFISETEETVKAIRFCSAHDISADKVRKLRNSLPQPAFKAMKKRCGQCVLTFNYVNGHFALESWDIRTSSVSALVNEYLSDQDGGLLAAWNMKCHDQHILRECSSQQVLLKYKFSDPLIDFRQRIGLPKNSLGTCQAGTPRGTFCVSNSFMGSVHTSLVDSMNMRQVCLRAFYNVQEAGDNKKNLAVRLSKPTCLRCIDVKRQDLFSAAFDIMEESSYAIQCEGWEKVPSKDHKLGDNNIDWVFSNKFWKPRELDPIMKNEFHAMLISKIEQIIGDKKLSVEETANIRKIETEVDLNKCLNEFFA